MKLFVQLRRFRYQIIATFASIFFTSSLNAQNRIGTGEVANLYRIHCASCHGEQLEGALGGSLVGGNWLHGDGSDEHLARVIRDGLPDHGMAPFDDVLSEQQIRSLVIYIREARQLAEADGWEGTSESGVFESEEHAFRLEKVAEIDGEVWGMDFLPDGDLLFTEFKGPLWRMTPGEEPRQIRGIPRVWRRGQGGMLDVAVHPNYAENGWIYLAFSASARGASGDAAMTRIVRGRVENDRWIDEETIFEVAPEFHLSAAHHFGTRIVFKEGYLFFAIGDRGSQEMAQDLAVPNGKIHRIHDDGRIPGDNPFSRQDDAYPTIWTYGNRNPQGIAIRPEDREIWAAEHGPRGGDEVNHIRRGVNYGWPVITYGINYNGTPITDRTHHPEMAQPVHYWTPSIAVCGIDFYDGDQFPRWKNNLFAGGLASEQLHRLVFDGDRIVKDEIVLRDQGRVRDVLNAPDGNLYVSLTPASRDRGTIFRLVPVD